MVYLASDSRHRLLRGLVFLVFLGAVSGGPIVAPQLAGRDDLVPRQQVTGTQTTAAAVTNTASAAASQTETASAAVDRNSASAAVSTAVATTRVASEHRTETRESRTTTQASSSASASDSSSLASSGASAQSTSSTSTQSASSTSAAATATTTAQPSIFSSSSKYFGYAVGVSVVVGIFGFLLLVLFIRFIVQLFTKKPQPPPINTTNRSWRCSQDSDFDSAGPIPNSAYPTGQSNLGPRHKDMDTSEMGERSAFLSTESVTLYPMPKFEEHQRYADDSARGHVRTFSSSSGSATASPYTPYASRRPMSFLKSPPATHPAFIVDSGSQSGHSAEGPEAAVVPAPHMLQPVQGDLHPNTNSLLLARASASEAYRQQTRSSTGLSRAASTASAYSTQPGSIPPVPELPPAWMLSGGGLRGQSGGRAGSGSEHLSPDVTAALTTMRGGGAGSEESARVPEGMAATPTEEGVPNAAPTARMMPGRAGWGRPAPTSVHGDDLYFLQH